MIGTACASGFAGGWDYGAIREIAERLGKSPDACPMLLARAMTALIS